MTRRGFFRALILAAVTAPATATLVPDKLAPVRAWWVPVESWVKEFDHARYLGVAMSFRNVLTGETVRNAVRYRLNGNGVVIGEAVARAHLDWWSRRLPAWRVPLLPGHGHFDDVLEGRETRLS